MEFEGSLKDALRITRLAMEQRPNPREWSDTTIVIAAQQKALKKLKGLLMFYGEGKHFKTECLAYSKQDKIYRTTILDEGEKAIEGLKIIERFIKK